MQAGDYSTVLFLKLLQNVRIEAEIQFSLLSLIDSVTFTLETPTTNQIFVKKKHEYIKWQEAEYQVIWKVKLQPSNQTKQVTPAKAVYTPLQRKVNLMTSMES